MKLNVRFVEGNQYVKISYSPYERLALDKKFQSLGLQTAETTNPFGDTINPPVKYWRDRNDVFGGLITRRIISTQRISVINNINDFLITDSNSVNISIFRLAVPELEFKSSRLLTSVDVQLIAKALAATLKIFLECEREIETEILFKVKINSCIEQQEIK